MARNYRYIIDALAAMRPEDMVVCDTEGYFIAGPPGSTQCFEVKMHSCIYKLYPDVQSVVHVHPRFTVLLTTLPLS
jgi:ribulose-5-phosphate 4-epimerase/fuculose-1-phosphate aldolase